MENEKQEMLQRGIVKQEREREDVAEIGRYTIKCTVLRLFYCSLLWKVELIKKQIDDRKGQCSTPLVYKIEVKLIPNLDLLLPRRILDDMTNRGNFHESILTT